VSKPCLRTTQPPVEWVPGIFPGVKRGWVVTLTTPSSAKVTNEELYSSPPCYLYGGSGTTFLYCISELVKIVKAVAFTPYDGGLRIMKLVADNRNTTTEVLRLSSGLEIKRL
jgi:hypothetical protein